MVLADEVLTPDSSRFWPRDSYQPGGPQPSFDKQYVRDYLESIHWNKQPPAPALPADVVATHQRKIPGGLPRAHGEATVNWIDILLVLVIGFSVLSGFTAGFARVGVGFIATILGIFLGFWCYGIAAAYVLDYVSSRAIANLIGFFAVFIGVVLIGAVIGRLLAKLFKWIGLSWLDRLLGAGFGFLRGVVIAVALVTVLLAFAPSPPPRSVVDSKLMPYMHRCFQHPRRPYAARSERRLPGHQGKSEEDLVGAHVPKSRRCGTNESPDFRPGRHIGRFQARSGPLGERRARAA